VPKAGTRVADALNAHGIRVRSRGALVNWTGFEIDERRKQYETRAFVSLPDKAAARRKLVEKWTSFYRQSHPLGGGVARETE
jgi:hypothetical protein